MALGSAGPMSSATTTPSALPSPPSGPNDNPPQDNNGGNGGNGPSSSLYLYVHSIHRTIFPRLLPLLNSYGQVYLPRDSLPIIIRFVRDHPPLLYPASSLQAAHRRSYTCWCYRPKSNRAGHSSPRSRRKTQIVGSTCVPCRRRPMGFYRGASFVLPSIR